MDSKPKKKKKKELSPRFYFQIWSPKVMVLENFWKRLAFLPTFLWLNQEKNVNALSSFIHFMTFFTNYIYIYISHQIPVWPFLFKIYTYIKNTHWLQSSFSCGTHQQKVTIYWYAMRAIPQTKISIWTFKAIEITQGTLFLPHRPLEVWTPPSFEITVPVSNSFPQPVGDDTSLFCNKQVYCLSSLMSMFKNNHTYLEGRGKKTRGPGLRR